MASFTMPSLLKGSILTFAPVLGGLIHGDNENALSHFLASFSEIIQEGIASFIIPFPTTSTEILPQQQTKSTGKSCFDPLSLLPSNIDRNYLEFPFFTDPHTYRHINSGQINVLFIMRGLSGSGKSTIVDLIKSSFDKCVICSADHFFYSQDGTYKFNEKLLGAAHCECQHKAKLACQAKAPVVVIDNTNVRRWEMKFYLGLGQSSGYVTVLVQPKTPWSLIPSELAARNSHGVGLDILERKVKTFEDVIPSYYGWLCDERKSASILRLGCKLLEECLAALPDFKKDLLTVLGIKYSTIDDETALGILKKFYTRPVRSTSLLHCTAKFCARGKVDGSAAYHKRQDVQASCGKLFTITIPGLVFTRKTMGARVVLGPEAMTLFCKPEEVAWVSPQKVGSKLSPSGNEFKSGAAVGGNLETYAKSGKKLSKKAQARVDKREKKKLKLLKREEVGAKEGVEEEEFDEVSNSSEEFATSDEAHCLPQNQVKGEGYLSDLLEKRIAAGGNKDAMSVVSVERCNGAHRDDGYHEPDGASNTKDLFPGVNYKGSARSAHLTLQTAQEVESKEVIFDLLRTCDMEREIDLNGEMAHLVPVSHGQACYYGDGLCCVYFEQPIKVKTIFSGSY